VSYLQESSELECMLRLLQLGQKAQNIIDTKDYYEDKLVSMYTWVWVWFSSLFTGYQPLSLS